MKLMLNNALIKKIKLSQLLVCHLFLMGSKLD